MANRRNGVRAIVLACVLGAAIDAVQPARAGAASSVKRLSEYSLTNWNEEDGPFPFGVLCIAQDRDGYLWLGGRTGLIRFDGSTFEVWHGSAPLPAERLSSLIATRDGALWLGFGTMGAVTQIRDGAVRTFGVSDGLAGGPVSVVYEDLDGTIWVGSYNGLSQYRDGAWTTFEKAGVPAEPVSAILRDRRGALWVGTPAGLYRQPAAGAPFARIDHEPVAALAQDQAGAIWGSDRAVGFRLLDGTPAFRDPQPPSTHAGAGRGLLVDRAGSLWVTTRGAGLMRLADGRLERLSHVDGLGSDDVRDVFEDRDGIIWIATRRGLSRLTERSIRSFTIAPARDAFVYAVASTRDGSVWTATADGLARTRDGRDELFGTGQGLPAGIVTALHEDAGGVLWVATTRGLARWSGARFEPLATGAEELRSVGSMTSDRRGRIWICDQSKGLFIWDHGMLTRPAWSPRDRKVPYSIHADSIDRVWVGFWDTGVAMFDPDGRVTLHTVGDGVPEGGVAVIHEDRAGRIWVGTERGVAVFEGTSFQPLPAGGLPESAYVSVVEDRQGFIWLASGTGLLRLSPRELERASSNPGYRLQYTLYGADDGLNGRASRPGMPSAAVRADGSLLFVTSAGVALVDPEHLRERPSAGRVRIERIVADGQVMDASAPITLPPRTSRLQVDYSTLSLAGVSKARFRYRLDGFDSDWNEVGDRRQALYTNLPPGNFTFRVVTADDVGWNASGAMVGVAVRPAFYQRPAFYAGAVLLVGAGIWAAWILRLRHVRRQYSLILAERARMGRELHDTLLQSLVGVALEFDDIAEQLDPEASPLRRQVAQVRQRVEHYIREARHSIWNLRSPTLETKDLASALREAGELCATHQGIDFRFTVTGRPVRMDATLEEQFLRIGQEAVNNAVRHAQPDTVRMALHYGADATSLTIEDDGCGFDVGGASHATDHWGLTTMRERARQVQARFTLFSEVGVGTTVTVIVPRPERRAQWLRASIGRAEPQA
ncbi:MAG: two-component regulator propeller domain-containing protein [Vicinamibacterales bacterium]